MHRYSDRRNRVYDIPSTAKDTTIRVDRDLPTGGNVAQDPAPAYYIRSQSPLGAQLASLILAMLEASRASGESRLGSFLAEFAGGPKEASNAHKAAAKEVITDCSQRNMQTYVLGLYANLQGHLVDCPRMGKECACWADVCRSVTRFSATLRRPSRNYFGKVATFERSQARGQ
jgi:hypothetical protein